MKEGHQYESNTIVTANSLATWSGTWSCQTVKVLSQNGMLKGERQGENIKDGF